MAALRCAAAVRPHSSIRRQFRASEVFAQPSPGVVHGHVRADRHDLDGLDQYWQFLRERGYEVDAWVGTFRSFWEQRMDALETELARGARLPRKTTAAGKQARAKLLATAETDPKWLPGLLLFVYTMMLATCQGFGVRLVAGWRRTRARLPQVPESHQRRVRLRVAS